MKESQLPKTNTKTPMPDVKDPLKENIELKIQVASGPIHIGSELCICSIHNDTIQIYEDYFTLKRKMKGGSWLLKKMGNIANLGKK